MKAEAWPQIDKIFQAAVELDPARRAVFLDDACGTDEALRSEVESLLTIDSREWDLLERSAFESAALLLADEQPRLTSGEQIGHYEIINLLGKGGMGEVFLARDRILNRMIALKLLPLDYTQDPARLLRFQREAQTVSALNHPNILTVYELGDVDGHQYISTELIEGETLRSRLARGPLSVSDALDVIIQVAGALAAAHRAAIVHRDIKPENIMLRPDGYVKVLDFGLAKLAEQAELDSRPDPIERTDISSRLLMGTPRYMSPEQVGGLRVDARSDIFSLGAVLYEMLAGCPPFDNKDPGKLAESILKDDPRALKDCLDLVPDGLGVVVSKMLSKDLESRYRNADDLLLELKLLKDEIKINDKSSHRKRPTQVQLATTVLAIVVAASAVIAYVSNRFSSGSFGSLTTNASVSESGKWTTKASLSSARIQAEPAVLNGVLYVAGGWNVCTPFADLEAYDAETDTWTQRAPMLTARGAHGFASLDGQLYAVGGSVDCGDHVDTVEAYDPTSNTWSRKTSLPRARAKLVVAASNGRLYSIGGITREGEFLDLNSEYDPETDSWTEKAPMPTARAGAAVAVVDGIIYVVGGQNASRALPTVEAYDPLTDSWISKQSMLTQRNALAVAELNGKIFAFGGLGNRKTVEEYDPVTDAWRVVAELPGLRSSVHAATFEGSIYLTGGYGEVDYLSTVLAFIPQSLSERTAGKCPTLHTASKASMPTPRGGMAVGVIDGIIYAAGGYDKRPGFLSVNEAYDPVADKWTAKAPMPIARETRTSGNSVVGGRLYVIGGNAGGYCSNANQAYDPKTDSWSKRTPMPTPRCHVGVVAHNEMIYAIGGTNTNGSIRYSTVEVYNPATDTWTTAAPMPTERLDARAVAMDGLIYAIGGWNPALSPDALDVVEAYDPITGSWTTKSPMPTRRYGMAVGQLKGLLIVAGGYGNEATLATLEGYDPVHDTWTKLTAMSTPREFPSGTTANDVFYVFGGYPGPDAPEFLATSEAFTLTPCSN